MQSKKRGRPFDSQEKLLAKQRKIINATAELLTRKHTNVLTVDQIASAAGISRPTFYRWFPEGSSQVIDILFTEASHNLLNRITNITHQSRASFLVMVTDSIKEYFNWCFEMGPVVSGYFKEGFDESSSIASYRNNTFQQIIQIFSEEVKKADLPEVTHLQIETLVSWIESAGFLIFSKDNVEESDIDQQCHLTINMATMFIERVEKKKHSQGLHQATALSANAS